MEDIVMQCYETHKQAFENWEEGEPVKAFFDLEGLKIYYQSGKWWHYKPIDEKTIEWW